MNELNTLSGEEKSLLALLFNSSYLLNLHSLCILRFGPCDALGKGSKRSTCTLCQFHVPSLCLMIELVFLYDFARSAKIKCEGFDWTEFHTFKHVQLSLISVV